MFPLTTEFDAVNTLLRLDAGPVRLKSQSDQSANRTGCTSMSNRLSRRELNDSGTRLHLLMKSLNEFWASLADRLVRPPLRLGRASTRTTLGRPLRFIDCSSLRIPKPSMFAKRFESDDADGMFSLTLSTAAAAAWPPLSLSLSGTANATRTTCPEWTSFR